MYTAKGRLELNSLLQQYSPLVRRLAHQMIAKLPANVEIDDLIQVGMIGLTDALSRFDAEQGVQFETFATQRIRGAMLDELRGAYWMSRGTRKQQREIEGAVHRLEQRLGRPPHEGEIAKEPGKEQGEKTKKEEKKPTTDEMIALVDYDVAESRTAGKLLVRRKVAENMEAAKKQLDLESDKAKEKERLASSIQHWLDRSKNR